MRGREIEAVGEESAVGSGAIQQRWLQWGWQEENWGVSDEGDKVSAVQQRPANHFTCLF